MHGAHPVRMHGRTHQVDGLRRDFRGVLAHAGLDIATALPAKRSRGQLVDRRRDGVHAVHGHLPEGLALQADGHPGGAAGKQARDLLLRHHRHEIERRRVQQHPQGVALHHPLALEIVDVLRIPDTADSRHHHQAVALALELVQFLAKHLDSLLERVHVLGSLVKRAVVLLQRLVDLGILLFQQETYLLVLQHNQRIAAHHAVAGRVVRLGHPSRGRDNRILVQPRFQHARGGKRIGHGNVEQRAEHDREEGHGQRHRTQAHAHKARAVEHVLEEPAHGHHDHGKQEHRPHDDRQYQVVLRYGDDESREKEETVNGARDAVHRIDYGLAP